MSIEGKKIFITGSTGGIGTAICNKYLNKNCILILTSSSEEKLEKLKKLYGNKHSYYNLDLSNIDNLEKKMQIISKEHKDIHILVNNAGILKVGKYNELSSTDFRAILQVNVVAPFEIIAGVIESMKHRKFGRIVNISSIWGQISREGRSLYSSSKAGLDALTKSFALEFAILLIRIK